MNLQSQHSLDEIAASAPPAQRMTPQEAEAVIRLWQQEQADTYGMTSRPSLADVAESLDIPADDVRRLLAQARGLHSHADSQEACIAREHGKLARRMALGTAAAALGALLLYILH